MTTPLNYRFETQTAGLQNVYIHDFDGNTPVHPTVYFEFDTAEHASKGIETIQAVAAATNQLWSLTLTEDQKTKLLNILRADGRPKDAKGVVKGFSAKPMFGVDRLSGRQFLESLVTLLPQNGSEFKNLSVKRISLNDMA